MEPSRTQPSGRVRRCLLGGQHAIGEGPPMEPSRTQPSGSQAVVSRCLGPHSAVCLAIAAGVCWNSKVFFIDNLYFF